METTLSKDSLKVGQRYKVKLPPGQELFVNDNYQFGIWVQKSFNNGTRLPDGQIASGKMVLEHGATVLDLCLKYPDRITIEVRKFGGYMPGSHEAEIDLNNFFKCFELDKDTTPARETSGHITTITVTEKSDGTVVCPDCGMSFGRNYPTTHACMG